MDDIFDCATCGWSGSGRDAKSELGTLDVLERRCANCDEVVGRTAVPPAEEARSDVERHAVERSERAHRAYLAATLKTPEQLPDIEGDALTLHWDHLQTPEGAHVVIRCGERVLWQEPAYFECFRRFEEIAHLLTVKYGPRLVDLVPTKASEPYLYGDEITAERRVGRVRQRIAESQEE